MSGASAVKRLRWSFGRAWLIGMCTFMEAVRLKLLLALLVLALFSLGSSFLLQEFNFGSSELKFIADFGFGGMTLFGSILSVFISTQLFFGEIEHRTSVTVLAKPIYRSEFLLGKFLGIWLALLCFLGAIATSLSIALFVRESSLMAAFPEQFADGRVIRYLDIWGFALLQSLRLGMLSAIVILFATYATSSLFSIVMGVLVWVVGQLQYLASASWGAVDSSLANGLLVVSSLIVPNFHLFDLGDKIALGEAIGFSVYLKLGVYGTLYATFYLCIASLSFRRREF